MDGRGLESNPDQSTALLTPNEPKLSHFIHKYYALNLNDNRDVPQLACSVLSVVK